MTVLLKLELPFKKKCLAHNSFYSFSYLLLGLGVDVLLLRDFEEFRAKVDLHI